MSTLLVFVAGGLMTFAMRFSFIYLMGRVVLPEYARRLLRFVPAAVLAAIIAPGVLLHSGRLDLSLGNSYLLAGTVAVIAALWIRNTLITILIGMGVLVLLRLI
jgi:branched-subunit amino acid transport protein